MTFVTTFITPEHATVKQALASWNECVSQYLTELDIKLAKKSNFRASIQVKDIGCLRLANPCSTATKVSHTRSCLARLHDDAYLLHLQTSGHSCNRQSGKEAILKPGDFTLCDTSRIYDLTFNVQNAMLVAVIPKQALKRRIANPDLYTCIPMSGCTGISAIVAQLLQSVWLQSDREDVLSFGDKLADNILDMLATAYGSLKHARAAESSIVSARRIMIRDFIEKNICEPELSLAYIAKATKYSVAYLHEIFKGEGESISRYIMRRRLEASAEALGDPNLSSVSISQIAYQWGFKNATHFGRLFKQHFFCTPSEYRQEFAGGKHFDSSHRVDG